MNPIFALCDLQFPQTGAVEFRYSIQHGDLNARNVLLPYDEPTTERPALIDFEKTRESSALLNLCYLACFILEASRSNKLGDGGYWKQVPGAFVKSICEKNGDSELDHGSWQLALNQNVVLFSQIWSTAKSPEEINSLSMQLRLTLGLTAMLRCYYEVRSFHNMKKSDLDEVTFWSRLYFRIAAIAFQPVLKPVDPADMPITNVTHDMVDFL